MRIANRESMTCLFLMPENKTKSHNILTFLYIFIWWISEAEVEWIFFFFSSFISTISQRPWQHTCSKLSACTYAVLKVMQGKNCASEISYLIHFSSGWIVNFLLTSTSTNYNVSLAVLGLWFGSGQYYVLIPFPLPSLLTAVSWWHSLFRCTLSLRCNEFSLPSQTALRAYNLKSRKNVTHHIRAEDTEDTFTTLIHQCLFLLPLSDQYTFQQGEDRKY